MNLKNIIKDINISKIINHNTQDLKINNIHYDSRKVENEDLFVCIEGYNTDGHNYIESAIKNGASVIALSKSIDYSKYPDTTFIECSNTRVFLAKAASNFFDNPSKKMKMIGITGTKGKTSITYILKSILEKSKYKVGLIGTTGIYYNHKKIESNRTTPESLDLHHILYDMHKGNIEIVIMEVSSHALDLFRVYDIHFEIAAFSNLSREHLGFHKTFENYFNAKAKLFDMCNKAIINIDDEYGKKIDRIKDIPKIRIGIKNKTDITPNNIVMKMNDTTINIDDNILKTKLFGEFNVYNILIAYAISKELNISNENIQKGLKDVSILGRMEMIPNNKDYNIIIDYAHSPDSLEQVLKTMKEYVKKRLILVFGCGGGGIQDPLKRKIMGVTAAKYADYIIITEDNPRTEKAEDICNEIKKGLNKNSEYEIIINREEAIKTAIRIYEKGDAIIIAGKGHENTQEYSDKIIPFSDLEVIKKYL